MLSSFAGKVAELEKQTNENAALLTKIQKVFGLYDKVNPVRELSWSQGDEEYSSKIKSILLQQQARTKETDFKLNRVFESLRKHDIAISELRYHVNDADQNEMDDFDENGILVDETTDSFAYNPMACEFTPRQADGIEKEIPEPSIPLYSSALHNSADVGRFQRKGVVVTGDADCTYSPRSDPGSLTREQPLAACLEATDDVQCEADQCLLTFTDINEELLYFKSRVVKLESEIRKKDELIQCMASK
jgi:hypothetical protein